MLLGVALENWVGLALAVSVACYLVVVLMFPERF